MSSSQRLSVVVGCYAGGRIVAGMAYHMLETIENYESSMLLPRVQSAYETYNLRAICRGSAGPAGWLSYHLSLLDDHGAGLGLLNVPALLWTRPWDVPTVCHFPQVTAAIPVHTVTLQVMSEPITLGPPDE